MTKNKSATRRAGAEPERPCEVCGTKFATRESRSGRRQRYCSGTCRQRARRARTIPQATVLRTHTAERLRLLATSTAAQAVLSLDEADLTVVRRAVAILERTLGVATDNVTNESVTENVRDAAAAPIPVSSPVPELATATPRGKIGGLTPSDEQAAIIDACVSGDNLVIEAGAGTGKTSTLRMAATLMTNKKGLYVAFNKAIATEAGRTFGSNVSCSTAHSLAYRAVGNRFKHRLNGPRLPAGTVADRLGITSKWVAGDTDFTPEQQARLALQMAGRYCRTADETISVDHAPFVNGLTPVQHGKLAEYLLPLAEQIWADQSDPKADRMPFTHDVYLKLWALTKPQLKADFVLFDEAQDADPLISSVVQSQAAQLIGVGDSCQAIYGWRGAVDALKHWPADKRLYLTESWRFGQPVADEANKWLGVLNAGLRLTGRGGPSTIGPGTADAVLCRTNAEAVSQAIASMDNGTRVALVGGGDAIRRLAEAARDLQSGRGTSHPELMAFKSWDQLRSYVTDDDAGADLATLVRLVDNIGADEVIAACGRLSSEDHAELTVSTAHKAKGREWNRVRIAEDFREPKVDEAGRPGRIPVAEAMLIYVAVTRARVNLDVGGVAWIDDHLAGRTRPAARGWFGGDPDY